MLLCQAEGIAQAVVIPIAHEEFGHRPIAFVKVTRATSQDEILSFLKDRLPGFKLPDQFYHWPEEAESSLKVNRRTLTDSIKHSSMTDLPYKAL